MRLSTEDQLARALNGLMASRHADSVRAWGKARAAYNRWYTEKKWGINCTAEERERFPETDWQDEVKAGDTRLGYNEWLLHKVEDARQEAKAIIKNYPKGRCPDCGEKIPKTVTEGDACKNCGHVFNA